MFLRLLMCLLIIGMVAIPSIGQAQGSDSQYFSDTRFSVRGDFLQFFNLRGRLEVFGPPVSPEMFEDGVRVQYFRNVRLEWHPENPRPYRVQLGLLGELISVRQPPLAPSQIPPANRLDQRYYPQTGHTIKGGFLSFFDQHGGIDMLGYPISELQPADNNRLVQWFQRGLLELHPDSSGGQIVLGSLGELALRKKHAEMSMPASDPGSGGITARMSPASPPPMLSPPMADTPPNSIITPARPEGMQVSASLKSSITGGGDASTQRVFVYVTDDGGSPLFGAQVKLVVSYPFGEQEFSMPQTDPSGLTSISFEVGRVEPGRAVVVKAIASYAGESAFTETSFLSWY